MTPYPSRLLLLWRLRLLIITVPFAVLDGFFYYINYSIFLKITALWLFLFLFFYTFYLPCLYQKRSYHITDQDISLTSGVFISSQNKILISNVQYLMITQTPLQHILHLSSLHIMTAGGALNLSGLSCEKAQELLHKLSHEMENQQL